MSLEQRTAQFITAEEGFTPRAVWDVNAWRIGHGSDTITFPDGTFRKVVQGDTTTKEMASADLQRRIIRDFFPIVYRATGVETWNKLPDNSKIALTSLSYNYGKVKKVIADAAKTLNAEHLARTLVSATYYDNQSQPENIQIALRKRRQREADLIRSEQAPKKKALLVAGLLVAGTALTIYALSE